MMVHHTAAVVRGNPHVADRRRYALPELSGQRRRGAAQRRAPAAGGRRGRGQAGGRRHAADGAAHGGGGHPGHGPPGADPAVGQPVRRLEGAGQDARRRRAHARRRAGAARRGLLRPGAGNGARHAWRASSAPGCGSRPSASARGRTATARCRCCTTCSAGIPTACPSTPAPYAQIGDAIRAAFAAYKADVQSGAFPGPDQTIDVDPAVFAGLERGARRGDGRIADASAEMRYGGGPTAGPGTSADSRRADPRTEHCPAPKG